MFDLMPYGRRTGDLFHYFDDLEKNFFGDLANTASTFRTDIRETDNSYVLEAELPGFNREDLSIDLDGNLLTIRAEHKDETKEEQKGNYLRRERKYGSFSRSFDVSNINKEGITARYDKGVLELTLPKADPAVPTAKQIEIK